MHIYIYIGLIKTGFLSDMGAWGDFNTVEPHRNADGYAVENKTKNPPPKLKTYQLKCVNPEVPSQL